MSRPSVSVPMKRPGRKHVDPNDTSVVVGLTLPAKQYDEYCRQALREDVSVPEIIRRELDVKTSKNS
jgi:hypothetical protein